MNKAAEAASENSSELAKHRRVREGVSAAIRDGQIQPGHRVPSERDLAAQFGVSYMTARRAITEMVEVGLLERRGREGTFVRSYGAAMLATRTLHLIYPDYDSSDVQTFLRLGARAGELEGWKTHVLRLGPSTEQAAIRALESGDVALVLSAPWILKGAFGKALQDAQGRAVVLGNRMDEQGVPSVLADDTQAIRLAVRRLREAGHTHIAFVSNSPDSPIDRVQIGAWRAALSAEVPQDLIVVNTPPHKSMTVETLARVQGYFEGGGQATALITPYDQMALAAMAGVRAVGKSVPEDVSLINSGDSPLLLVAHPTVTSINVHIEQHIEQGIKFLRATLDNQRPPFDVLRFIEPDLVERESVAPLNIP